MHLCEQGLHVALMRQSARNCGSSDRRHPISDLDFKISFSPSFFCFSHLISPFHLSLAQSPLHCTSQGPSVAMPLSMLFILAIAFTSIANAQHGQHGRPFVKLNAHRALSSPLFPRAPNATGTAASSAAASTGPMLKSSSSCGYWLEDIEHQGYSPFHANPSNYQVFRNVKDYGAFGMSCGLGFW